MSAADLAGGVACGFIALYMVIFLYRIFTLCSMVEELWKDMKKRKGDSE